MLLSSRRMRAALLATAAACVLAAAPPPPAPAGIGDPLFPRLGNPGYDVLSYDIGFTYQGDNSKPLEAVTTIDARATDWLDRINLDFARGTVHGVEVNGKQAEFASADEDLVITPRHPVYGERSCGSPSGTPATRAAPRTAAGCAPPTAW